MCSYCKFMLWPYGYRFCLNFGVSNEWWLDGLFKNWVDFKMDLDVSTYFNVSRLKTQKMSLCVCVKFVFQE